MWRKLCGVIFFLDRRTRPPCARWSARHHDPSASWRSKPPSSRRGDWGTTTRGCDGLARSGATLDGWRLAGERKDPGCPWQRRDTRFAPDVRVVELQPVQIELDRTPGVRCHQVGEVVRQLLLGQTVNSMTKGVADSADGV